MAVVSYTYRKSDGLFLYEFSGSSEVVTANLSDDQDFTFIPPPDSESIWHWNDDKWQLEPTNKEVQSDKNL